MQTISGTDAIDKIRGQWRRTLRDLDTSPLETIGRIHRVAFLLAPRIREVLEEFGLDLGALDVLATLRRAGSPYRLSPTHLYRELALTSGAMTHRLDALERAGLLGRVPDPEDRRGVLAALTPKGRGLAERAMEAHMKLEAQTVASLLEAERAQLAKLLKKLLIVMESDDA
jgi:DNA-binding MarR family transcriptional regulator